MKKKEKERGLGGENRKKPQKEMFSRKDIASEKEMNNSGGHNNISGARRRSNNRFFWFLVIGVLIFYVGVAWGKKQSEPGNSPMEDISSFVNELSNPKSLLKNAEKDKPEKVDFGVFWDAWQVVDSKYINADQIKPQERVYGAIEGMLEATGDPYTNFMNPQETKTFNTDMEGSFEGIGAEIGIRDDTLTIVAPIDGMPAEEAGLKSGDKVMKINGESTADLAIDEAVKKIRGPKGTEVTLTIFREGESETQDIKIKRDEIDLQSVRYEKKDGNIAYIQIVSFSEDTAKEFNKEITKAIADGSEGIVLDLRNNPGGYLNVAVEVASKFISRGEVVVQEKEKRRCHQAQGYRRFKFI